MTLKSARVLYVPQGRRATVGAAAGTGADGAEELDGAECVNNERSNFGRFDGGDCTASFSRPEDTP